jgi:hypothetical protein
MTTKTQRYKEALERHKRDLFVVQSHKPEPPSFRVFRPSAITGHDKVETLAAKVMESGSLELHQQIWLTEAEAADFARWLTKWYSPDTCYTSKREQGSGPDDHDVDGKGGGGPDEAPATSAVGIVPLPVDEEIAEIPVILLTTEGEPIASFDGCLTDRCVKGLGHDGVCELASS